jgi:putative oxidoreductase
MTPLRTVARAMLAAVFVRSGIDAMMNPDRLVERAKPVTDALSPALDSVGLPTDARTLVRVNGAAQVAGGLMLASGTAPRSGALLLAGSMVPTTFAGHRFWEENDPTRRAHQRIHFLKNLGLLGGLLIAAVDTEGRPGLAWRAGHLAEHAGDSLRRAARTTARETRRAAEGTTREARRAARSTARTTRTAAKAAKVGYLLPR